jgi:hypothetical protein
LKLLSRVWVLIVVAIVALLLTPAMVLAFAGGDGTPENPYLIATAGQLATVGGAAYLDKHFILANDIDLEDYLASGGDGYNDGQGWQPIGTSSVNKFTGSFDGNGHVVRNLVINRPTTDYVGLFGYIDNATIGHVGINDVSIQGRDYTGGLVGYAANSGVENAHVTGQVSGRNHAGGLAGWLAGGSLHYAYSDVSVLGTGSTTGGLVARTSGGVELRHTNALGSITGASYSGGLVGFHENGIIIDSYSRAAVSGADYLGGLVGQTGTVGGQGHIYRSYSSGAVTGTGSPVGGFLGHRYSGTVADSYWDTEASGRETSAGGSGVAGKTTAEMQQQATYRNYNFFTLWSIDEGNDYPVFRDLGAYTLPAAVDLSELDGTGTEADPYIITNAHELNAMRQDPAASYRLGNNIDLSASVIWDYGRGWEPVGTSSQKFTGGFDGNGYTIQNLAVNRPRTDYTGLFGYIDNAAISRVGLEDVNLQGWDYTGGLVGYATGSEVKNVHVTGQVTGHNTCTGGLAGYAANSGIENVYATGQVSGYGSHTGGLAGWLHGGSLHHAHSDSSVQSTGSTTGGLVSRTSGGVELRHTYALGSVTAVNYSGGLVGFHENGIIIDSYSRAAVSGADYLGGLAGYAGSIGGQGNIYRSYSSGAVTGTGSNVGGFLGHRYSGTVADSYWDTEASGRETSAGDIGVAGKTTAQMKQQATFDGWEFGVVWSIQEGISYPYLLVPLTIEGTFTVVGKEYDGSSSAVLDENNLSLVGVKRGDEVILNAVPAFADVNVGQSITVNLNDSTLGGADGWKYGLILDDAPTATADITAKGLNVVNAVAQNKVYDAGTEAVINGAELSGVVGDEDVTLDNHTTGTFAQSTVGTGITVNTAMTISGADAGNYTLVQPALTANITVKELTIGGSFTAGNKVYDGTTAATIIENNLTLIGIVSDDDVTLSAVAAFADANVGDYILVSLTGASTLGGVDAGNYTLSLAGAPIATANIIAALSNEADLSNLTLSSGILSPTFASETLEYTASVSNSVSSITVTPTAVDPGASISVNDSPVSSGTASGSISLSVGANNIYITVTAGDGITAKTYTVTVARAGATSPGNGYMPAPPPDDEDTQEAMPAEEPVKVVELDISQLQANVDGEPYILDSAPFIKPGVNRTMVPVRFISEALGAQVYWWSETRQVIIGENRGGRQTEIILTIGSGEALVNGIKVVLDCPPEIISDRTFLPMRFVSEMLGAQVYWDAAAKRITITR